MSLYKKESAPSTKLAGESERAVHKKPTVVTIPSNAVAKTSTIDAAQATGTTSVGDAIVSSAKATAKGVTEIKNAITDGISKVQSGIARAQSAASDPVGFAISLAESQSGFSIPSSPEGVANLLAKLSKPDTRGDGTTDISKEKKDGSDAVAKLGDIGSDFGAAVSKVTSSIGAATSAVGEVTGSVTELASLGGVPVDNVISNSVNKITQPVQTSLQKVKSTSDNTQGIIT